MQNWKFGRQVLKFCNWILGLRTFEDVIIPSNLKSGFFYEVWRFIYIKSINGMNKQNSVTVKPRWKIIVYFQITDQSHLQLCQTKSFFLRFRLTKCSNDHFLVRTRRLTVPILDARWRTRMKLFRDPSFSSPVSRSGWRYRDWSKVGLELEDTRSATLYKRSRKPLKF